MKILVCGGREYGDKEALYSFLDSLLREQQDLHDPITHLIHGDARGADSLAQGWAVRNGVQPVRCPALWEGPNGYNPRAGLIRNQAMLDLNPDVVIAFPGGRGTEHMKNLARTKGVKLIAVRV